MIFLAALLALAAASGDIRFTTYPTTLSCDGTPFALAWEYADATKWKNGDAIELSLRQDTYDVGDVLSNDFMYGFGTVEFPATNFTVIVPTELASKLATKNGAPIDALLAAVKVGASGINSGTKKCFGICVGFDKNFKFSCAAPVTSAAPTVAPTACAGKNGCDCLDGKCPEFPAGLSCSFFGNKCTAGERNGTESGPCFSNSTCEAPLACVSGWCMKKHCTWPATTSLAGCPCGTSAVDSERCETNSTCSYFGGLCGAKRVESNRTSEPLVCRGKEIDILSIQGAVTWGSILLCLDSLDAMPQCSKNETACDCAQPVLDCFTKAGCTEPRELRKQCQIDCPSVCPSGLAAATTLSAAAALFALFVRLFN